MSDGPGDRRAARRFGTAIEDGTVYVEADLGRIEVGDVETIVGLLGGPAWTIEYGPRDRPHAADAGPDGGTGELTVDVVDTIHAMTVGEGFVEALRAQPPRSAGDDGSAVSPRLGLFLGRLLENLEHGVR